MIRFQFAIVSILMVAIPTAIADTTGTIPTSTTGAPGTVTTAFTNMAAPNFMMAQGTQMGNFGSCFTMGSGQQDVLTNSIVQLTTGKDKTAKASGSCAKVDAKNCSMAYAREGASCPSPATLDRIDFYFKSLTKQVSDASCCVKGKESQLQEATKELGCIQQQNELLAQQVRSIQATMQQNLTQAHKDLAQIDNVVMDRVNQTNFILEKLNGNKEGTTPGLLKLQESLQKIVSTQLPADVKKFQDSITLFNQQTANFNQQIQNVKMGKAKACMLSPNSQYQCSVNSTGVCSASDLILAKFYEQARTINGRIQRNNKSNQAEAQSQKAALEALIATIFNNMAVQTNFVPLTQDQAQSAQQHSMDTYQVNTPADLERVYGSQLAKFNTSGFNVHDFFENVFQNCFVQANADVTREMSTSNSDYTVATASLTKQKKDIQDGFKQFFKGYGDMYSQFWSTMGVTAPINSSKCEDPSVPLAQMMTCANDLSTNLQGIYSGTTPNSLVNVSMPGTSQNPVTQFAFSCYGVNGCITTMRNVQSNLKNETSKLDTQKKNYILQANASIDQFKGQISGTLSAQNQMLAARLATLRTALSSNGVQDPLATQAVKKSMLDKEKTRDSNGNEYDGLYQMPQDFLGALGGDLNPPLIDPTSGSFDNARQEIAAKLREDDAKDREITTFLASLEKQKEFCAKGVRKEYAQAASQQVGALVGSCATSDDWCTNGGQNSLSNLYSSLSGITLDVDSFDQIQGILDTGIQKCKDSSDSLREAQNVQKNAKNDLDSCLSSNNSNNTPCANYQIAFNNADRDLNRAVKQAKAPASCAMISNKANTAVKKVIDSRPEEVDSGSTN